MLANMQSNVLFYLEIWPNAPQDYHFPLSGTLLGSGLANISLKSVKLLIANMMAVLLSPYTTHAVNTAGKTCKSHV